MHTELNMKQFFFRKRKKKDLIIVLIGLMDNVLHPPPALLEFQRNFPLKVRYELRLIFPSLPW